MTTVLFTLAWMSMMLSVYPGAALAIIAIAAATWGVRATGRERRQREALAARADYEHRALMARTVFDPLLQVPSGRASGGHGADHWSITQPIRRSA